MDFVQGKEWAKARRIAKQFRLALKERQRALG